MRALSPDHQETVTEPRLPGTERIDHHEHVFLELHQVLHEPRLPAVVVNLLLQAAHLAGERNGFLKELVSFPVSALGVGFPIIKNLFCYILAF